MIEKNMKSRHVQKHATESEWLKANIFIPKQAEIIVYDVDENHSYERFKIGDGVTLLKDLPFSNETIDLTGYATEEYVEEYVNNAITNIDIQKELELAITDDGLGNVTISEIANIKTAEEGSY